MRTPYGGYRYWDLKECLSKEKILPITEDVKENLNFLLGIRHEIEHQMTRREFDEYISGKLQACAMNFDYYLSKLFGSKYSISDQLALVIQFSPLTVEQKETLKSTEHLLTNVRNFVTKFEDKLSENTLQSNHYAYKVVFQPYLVNRPGQADQIIKFTKPESSESDNPEYSYALIKETEKII